MDISTIIEGIELADVLISAVIGSVLVSEALPHMKKIKANSVMQLAFNILKIVAAFFRK